MKCINNNRKTINRKNINRKKKGKNSRKINLLLGGNTEKTKSTKPKSTKPKSTKPISTKLPLPSAHPNKGTDEIEGTGDSQDMNLHFKDITPDNLKNLNTTMIGEQVSKFGKTISNFWMENINTFILQFNDMVTQYIEPLDIKLFGSSLHMVMLKSNILLKEIRPELEVVFKELIELYGNLLDDSNPLLKKIISSFIDNITSVFTMFITKIFGIMSITILDIIKAIPFVGEILDIIQLFSRSSLCFFQILSQILSTYRDVIDIINLLTSGTKENIENLRTIKNAFLNILYKLGNTFRNIIPDISKQAQKMVDSVPNISKHAQKMVDSVPNISNK